MTPEQRLDRVERILGLFASEGRRWRVLKREQDEKINILIQTQMETSEQIKQTGEQIKQTGEQLNQTGEQLKQTGEQLNQTGEQLNQTGEQLNQTGEQLKQINRLGVEFRADLAASHAIHEKEMAEIRREHKLTEQSLRAFIDSSRKGRNGASSD